MGFLTQLLSAFFGQLLQFIGTSISNWYSANENEANAWAAKAQAAMLASIKSADALQLQIKNTPVDTAATPADWNAGVKP